VVVAVVAVRMVEVPVDQIVDVIAMRDGLVAATGAMVVRGVVTGALVRGSACSRIGGRDLDHVLVDVIAVHVVQVTVVQVVDVAVVPHGRVTATGAMNVCVVGMGWIRAIGHRALHGASFADVGNRRFERAG